MVTKREPCWAVVASDIEAEQPGEQATIAEASSSRLHSVDRYQPEIRVKINPSRDGLDTASPAIRLPESVTDGLGDRNLPNLWFKGSVIPPAAVHSRPPTEIGLTRAGGNPRAVDRVPVQYIVLVALADISRLKFRIG
ncbi:hypothetical protein [Halohasta litchfieldiae]|uniref:hypothetical protein n=1 Tax=Halohasta litchfieldiae TaxID=1073996 RepID=UPI00115F7CCC|nr:hypothetical protein [Halohasta litchfieldiae]